MSKIKPYIISVIIALLTGGLSALLTAGNMDIYNEVNTPPLSPPSILFPIVWTLLYVLMGISAALIHTDKSSLSSDRQRALTVYGISLFVNFFWSILFFNLQAYLFAFIWLLLLLGLIVKTITEYYKIRPIAAYLQIPYLLWVAFAGYLNLGIWLLNKS